MKLYLQITSLIFILSVLFADNIKTITIRSYTISKNFGTETRELTRSTFIRYNKNNQILDSTLYIHNIPLAEKYSYIDFNDRYSLKKIKGIERIMHFKFDYNIEGKLVSKTLFGTNNDSIRWKEFYKYYSNGKLWKSIRFDPSKINEKNMLSTTKLDIKNIPWGETFSYSSNGSIKEHKEFYGGVVLESTIYNVDTIGALTIKSESYDPSIMEKINYSYSDNGKINQKIRSRRGYAISSETYEYDTSQRIIKINYFNQDGVLEKLATYIYNDVEKRQTKIITDASNKLVHRVESKKNSNNKNIIEAIFNSKSNLIQKKNIGYNLNGKIARIHDYDMLKPEENEKPKLINIITYEYK